MIITRAKAREIGLKWYFNGVPCPKGHVAKRNVGNCECRKCVDAKRAANPERSRPKDKRRNGSPKRLASSRKSRARHIEKRRAYDRNRYHNDAARNARSKNQAGNWWKLNRGKKNFMTARRRAAIKRASPPWLSKEQKREIRAIYIEASARVGDWHVDHIVPISGSNVCGLHVPWNLQIITANENRKKRNDHED